MTTGHDTLVDMHNRITAGQLEKILRMQVQTLMNRPECARSLPPLMVWGAPGVGKSAIIRKIADDFGIGFIDVRLAQREPVDIRGLPVPDRDRKCVDWMVSGEWPRDGRGILLFDELTAADRSLQVAAYEMILDRRLGDLYHVPDGWYICGAGNRVEDSAVSGTMSSALANRFMHVELMEDVESWAKWAVQNGIHPSVVGFLRYRPEFLFRQEGENLERGWPTPRAWERVSTMLGVIPEEDKDLLAGIVYGIVGNHAGIEFVEYHKLGIESENVRELMLDGNREIHIPEKVDRKYAFCSAVGYHVWRGNDSREQEELLNGFYRISLKLSSDFACMVMTDAMFGGGIISQNDAVSKLFYHPMYRKWAETHGASMKKYGRN